MDILTPSVRTPENFAPPRRGRSYWYPYVLGLRREPPKIVTEGASENRDRGVRGIRPDEDIGLQAGFSELRG